MKKAFTIVELPPSLKFRRASLVPNKNVKQGFTIVELLVVIVVIGILAAITIVSYTGLSNKAIVSSLQSDLTNGSKKLKMYQVEYGSYPAAMTNDGSGNYCPSGSTPADTRYCLKPSSSNAFTYISSSPYSIFSLSILNGNTRYSITNNTSPIPGGWIVGIVATALANKWVYSVDISTKKMYKTTNTYVTSPQGSIGLDTTPYDTHMTLVADNTIDFTAYPARQACKDLNGRLPSVYELQAIYAGRIYYGDNFPIDQWGYSFHGSATEYSGGTSGNEAWSVNFVSGRTYTVGKMDSTYVRCVNG